jgi:hypothetical protein
MTSSLGAAALAALRAAATAFRFDRSILVGCGSGGDSCPDDDVKR